jgi:membrane-associated protease RseP (regulator of RpoE activity)
MTVPSGSFPPPSGALPGGAPPDSVPPASDPPARASEPPDPPRFRPWVNLLWFLATLLSVLYVGMLYAEEPGASGPAWRRLLTGWIFAVPLLGILLVHELGHYVAARLHRVPASLPYFIPLPISPIGTFGAIIVVPDRIRSRNALLDFGAAGPLAGLIVALPVLALGLALSEVGPPPPGFGLQEGQSLLYLALKRLMLGPIPEGQDVLLHPVAFAGWAGLLVTFLNLVPFGQLDGGHVAYALFGRRLDALGPLLLLLPIALAVYNLVEYVEWISPATLWTFAVEGGFRGAGPALSWLVVLVLLLVLRGAAGREHPPVDAGPLSPARRVIGVATLLLFPLLFMPTPMRVIG